MRLASKVELFYNHCNLRITTRLEIATGSLRAQAASSAYPTRVQPTRIHSSASSIKGLSLFCIRGSPRNHDGQGTHTGPYALQMTDG